MIGGERALVRVYRHGLKRLGFELEGFDVDSVDVASADGLAIIARPEIWEVRARERAIRPVREPPRRTPAAPARRRAAAAA